MIERSVRKKLLVKAREYYFYNKLRGMHVEHFIFFRSAKEALLKRCSHFDLETHGQGDDMKVCEVIVHERTKQLLRQPNLAFRQEKPIPKSGDECSESTLVLLRRKVDGKCTEVYSLHTLTSDIVSHGS